MTFKTISTTVVGTIDKARLYDETIDKVIAVHPEVHAELPCIIEAVESTIANPTHVEKSHSNTVVFVSSENTNASGDPLKVPVRVVEGTSGRVTSFYFAESTDDQIIWRKP
jgi:hypothetical protein